MSTSHPWWETYFSEHYARLYRGPLRKELMTDVETRAIKRLFGKARGPVLDIGCGYGRLLAPAVANGMAAFGVDFSMPLLRTAEESVRGRVARSDMRDLPIRPRSLAGAWMLFNSFGYFDDEQNADVLVEIRGALMPGAVLMMDLPARTGMRSAVRDVPTNTRQFASGAGSLVENWSIEGNRLMGTGEWETGGTSESWTLSIRLYTPREFSNLLRASGFEYVEIRPIEDMARLGTKAAAPAFDDAVWRTASSMAVLARAS